MGFGKGKVWGKKEKGKEEEGGKQGIYIFFFQKFELV